MECTCNLVLLVDDDPTDTFIAARILKMARFANQIIQRSNVTDALDYLRSGQNNSELLPDFIFLDINMPLHNGFDFLDEFQALSQAIKSKCRVIVLSSSDSKKDIHRILQYEQVIRFITKPLSEEALLEIPR